MRRRVWTAAIAVLIIVGCGGCAADTIGGCEADKTCGKTAGTVRYDVSGNDNGPALKEIVVVDATPLNVTDDGPVTAGTTAVAATGVPKSTTKTTAGGAATTVGTATNNAGGRAKTTAGTTVKTTAGGAATTVGTATITTGGGPPNTTAGATAATVGTTMNVTGLAKTTAATETAGATSANNDAAGILRLVSHKYCYCDIVYGGCDINCCCDTDCTSHDLKSFTMCTDRVQSSLIKPVSILFDSSLFYVVVDNVPSDYFYPERAAIQSESQVAMSLRNRDVFAWSDGENNNRPDPVSPQTEPVYNNYDLTYKSLRWMYTVVSDVNATEIKTFGLINSAFGSLCAVEQPVEYLSPKETHCQTYVTNLTAVCNGDTPLSYERYYGKTGLFKAVQPINSGVHKTETFGLTTVRAAAYHHCVTVDGSSYDCRTRETGVDDGTGRGPRPVYTAGVCRRVVEAVEYSVTHNGTGGVRGLDVHIYHRDVPDAGRPVYLDHRFTVRFVRANRSAADVRYARSGKPGYAVGHPVLLITAGTYPANRSRGRRPEPFDLPGVTVRGTCAGMSRRRQPVNFLENVRVQCRVPVRWRRFSNGTEESTANHSRPTEMCRHIQNETISALGEHEGTLVASLGDPEVAAWIPAVVVKPAWPAARPPDDSSCPSVINGMHVRVLFSQAGTPDSPRAAVLGVSVNYTASPVAAGAVLAGYVPVTATVVFVDITRPPVRTFAEPPTYEFRLPEDFYYPFWSPDRGEPPPPPPPAPSSNGGAAIRHRPPSGAVHLPTLPFVACAVVVAAKQTL